MAREWEGTAELNYYNNNRVTFFILLVFTPKAILYKQDFKARTVKIALCVCVSQQKKNPVAAMQEIIHILKSHQKKYEPNSSGKALLLTFSIYTSFSPILCFSWDIHIVCIH